jgi:hypothetical protein
VTAKRIVLPILVAALVATAFVIPFGSPSSSNANAVVASAAPTLGYTIVGDGAGLCDLNTIDLATGALTDLTAPSSEAACANDLAVAPNGTVYGITGYQFLRVGSVSPAADELGDPQLITFSANGTPSGQTLTVNGAPISGIYGGSIAVDAAGTMYVIAVNETTCDSGLVEPRSIDTSDSLAYNCLFTVNIATGVLTHVGDGFSPNHVIFGLASCASKLWAQVPGFIAPANGNQPASLGMPWASINPATGVPTEAGISTQIFGFDCLAAGDTIYAMSTDFLPFGPTSIEPQGAAPGSFSLGTVDPATGVFTETVTLSTIPAFIPWPAFAVAPLPVVPVVPDPVAPIFTR